MINTHTLLKKTQYFVLLLGVLLFFWNQTSHAQLINPDREPLVNKSYFNNTEKAKQLYDEKKEIIKQESRVKMPPLPIATFVTHFNIRLKESLGNLYFPLVYFALITTTLFQYALAKSMRHKYPEMALGYLLWIGLLVFNQTTHADIQSMSILVFFCIIPPLWQIFQLAQFSFLKTLFSNLLFALLLYAFTASGSPLAQNILLAIWTIYIIVIYVRISTYLTHTNQISSWNTLTGIIPLFGPATFLLLSIRSRQMMENISTSFVNIILKLLQQEKSRLEIRNYALASRVRLSFFEHNFNIAFRLFEEGKTKVSPLLYKLSRQFTLASLGAFIILSISAMILTSNLSWAYFQEWQQGNAQKTFLELISKDNDLLIEDLIQESKVILEPDCEKGWENCYPLFIAVENDSHNVLKVLLESGVSLTNTNNDGETIVTIAEDIGSKEIIRLLKTEQFQRSNQR